MIKDFVPRLYQQTILNTCVHKNCLVVLPTGMGKTGIAVLLAAQRLRQYPQSKVVVLAPTKPLVEQHLKTFQQHLALPQESFAVFTGEVSPSERAEQWNAARVILATPQGLENDVLGSKISLKDVSLLVLDEAHRAVGDYSYVFLAKRYNQYASFPRILALTASPGSEQEKIDEVCTNLFIDAVEVRTEKDHDVKEYVQELNITWVELSLPEDIKRVHVFLTRCATSRLETLKQLGLAKTVDVLSKRELLGMQAELQSRLASGERDMETMQSLSVLAEVLKVQHAIELIETQGVAALSAYIERLFGEATTTKTKAVKRLVVDPDIRSARVAAKILTEKGIEHPKIGAVRDLIERELSEGNKKKIILFTQYRDSATTLYDVISKIPGVTPVIFVGQAKKAGTGLTQKKQVEILDKFREGVFNVLIATSVAEEGLDVPQVDLVVFYEPIPSAIRQIQRRGRTGRQAAGRMIAFVTKGTRDEGYRWSAFHKEKRMHALLKNMKATKNIPQAQPQQTLIPHDNGKYTIFADYREKSNQAVKMLAEMGVMIKLEMLSTADFLLSSRVGVEFKTTKDFVDSIIDGRLLEQSKMLAQNFERPLIIIEGQEDIYTLRQVHPNAIRGALAVLAISYGIPIIQTKNTQETASLLYVIVKREQEEDIRPFSPHAEKRGSTLKEQQEYVISSFPQIGTLLAKDMLKYFGSIKNIVNAPVEELKKVAGVGEKKAEVVKKVSEERYEGP